MGNVGNMSNMYSNMGNSGCTGNVVIHVNTGYMSKIVM